MNDDLLLNLFIDNMRKFLYPEELIKLDMTLSKTELLTLLIIDRQGEIIMSQIADYIRVPLSTATGIVDRLVKNKYLKRERSESDRRIVVIHLSDKGQEIINEFKKTISGYINLIDNALTEEERDVLYKLFLKITQVLGEKAGVESSEVKTKSTIHKIPIE